MFESEQAHAQHGPNPPVARMSRSSFYSGLIVLILSSLLLSTPALINKFPLIFYDTSTYLARADGLSDFILGTEKGTPAVEVAITKAREPDKAGEAVNPFFLRPFTYSLFLLPFANSATLFLAPIAQALIACYFIRRAFHAVGVYDERKFTASIVVLALLSSLPIHVNYIMPDIFTGVLVVAAFCVVYDWPRRNVWQRLFDMGAMTFLVAVHLSHIPIALALLVLFLLAPFVMRGAFKVSAAVLGVGAPMALAITALVGSNLLIANKAVISESSSLFLLARLVGDGPARAYLHQACPQKGYVLCSELDRLGQSDAHGSISDFFLWSPDGAVKKLNSPRLLAEAAEINSATIHAYPLEVAGNGVRNAFRQLATFQVDDDVNNRPSPLLTDLFDKIDPVLTRRFLDSAQSRGMVPLGLARTLVGLGLAAAAAAFVYLVAARRDRIAPAAWMFAFFATAGLMANALAIGALSEVHDRYQNRVIWLAPLIVLIMFWSSRSRPASSPAASGEGRL